MDDQGGARAPKACRACAKAKVRCDPESNGPCKRCRRLNKECSDQVPGAHRRPKPAASIEVSALEAKLDRMVTLLAASEHSKGPVVDSSGQPSAAYSIDQVSPGEIEGEVFLEIFRIRMSPLFPFIPLSVGVTAGQLQREKPFLYLNICAIACQNPSRQRIIINWVREYIAERTVHRGEHSLDLLQGLVIHLAWYISISRQARPDIPGASTEAMNADLGQSTNVHGTAQLDVFLRLAVSQVISSNLHQGVASVKSLDRPLAYMRAVDFHPYRIASRTIEERRAYLGCYYLTVIMSACVKDLEPLRFSKYTEECCQVLSETMEFPTDTFAVQLVRIAHLADKITQTVSLNALDSPAILSAPLGMSIRFFQTQIQQLRTSVTADAPQSTVLGFHYDTLEIILYRLALADEIADSPLGNGPVTRLDLLFRCLEATKSFFYSYQYTPPVYLPFFPFSLWCQFGHAIVTMSRLLLYRNDSIGWDQSYVRTTVDFDETLDGLKKRLDEALSLTSANNPDGELPELFGRLHARVELLREIHHRREEHQKEAAPRAPEPADMSFMYNLPFDAFFPYGDFGGFSAGLQAPLNGEFPMQ
ncbi:hypothetical protein N7492_009123 [Penicillium capsulatum]|uniref:Zn(2)-C6 fungal-type domain-containing protein n=1 Tax=Penicillium capsulatum TaxID=69766 RepID=A0A9W9HU16_9EURO|nr:hypothetical protein N7492_009123 [Penicillium capsulatum]KAJ6106522.1 hypothetical protein N7512_010039 [Penicillium capsulatum]